MSVVLNAKLVLVQGRIGILKVHARDKELDADVDFHKIARATAGSTGAELMNLMNQSAILTVRQGREKITEVDVFEVSFCTDLFLVMPAVSVFCMPNFMVHLSVHLLFQRVAFPRVRCSLS